MKLENIVRFVVIILLVTASLFVAGDYFRLISALLLTLMAILLMYDLIEIERKNRT